MTIPIHVNMEVGGKELLKQVSSILRHIQFLFFLSV